jgi:hypothetical protein
LRNRVVDDEIAVAFKGSFLLIGKLMLQASFIHENTPVASSISRSIYQALTKPLSAEASIRSAQVLSITFISSIVTALQA